MSYFLFVDESGHDRKLSPAEVLGGFAIRDGALWPFIQAVFSLQKECFGLTYPQLNADRRAAQPADSTNKLDIKEIKGDNFLNPRVFKRADWCRPFEPDRRRELAEFALRHGAEAKRDAVAALNQAKLDYVNRLFELCHKYRAQCLAIIVPADAPGERKVTVLRKDYAYLFERFFYFVDAKSAEHMGIIVLDELDKVASHILLGQMQAYYQDFRTGRDRSERLVPEPLFVHSDLTVGVQVADLVAYVLNWGHDFNRHEIVPKPRTELQPYVESVKALRIDSRAASL